MTNKIDPMVQAAIAASRPKDWKAIRDAGFDVGLNQRASYYWVTDPGPRWRKLLPGFPKGVDNDQT